MLTHSQPPGLLAAATAILPSVRAAAALRRQTVCASPLAGGHLDRVS